jgi:hypothetical protein
LHNVTIKPIPFTSENDRWDTQKAGIKNTRSLIVVFTNDKERGELFLNGPRTDSGFEDLSEFE